MASVITCDSELDNFEVAPQEIVRIDVPGDGSGNCQIFVKLALIICRYLVAQFNPDGDSYHEKNNAVEFCFDFGLTAKRPNATSFILHRNDTPKLVVYADVLEEPNPEECVQDLIESIFAHVDFPGVESGLIFTDATGENSFFGPDGEIYPAYIELQYRLVKMNGRDPNPTNANSTTGEDATDGEDAGEDDPDGRQASDVDEDETIDPPLNNRWRNNYFFRTNHRSGAYSAVHTVQASTCRVTFGFPYHYYVHTNKPIPLMAPNVFRERRSSYVRSAINEMFSQPL